jgi:hypothetical protein
MNPVVFAGVGMAGDRLSTPDLRDDAGLRRMDRCSRFPRSLLSTAEESWGSKTFPLLRVVRHSVMIVFNDSLFAYFQIRGAR